MASFCQNQIIPDLVLLSMRNLEFHWLQGRHWRHHSRIHEVAKLPSAEVLDMALSKMDPKKKQGYMDQLKKSTTCPAPVPAVPAPAEIRPKMEAAKVEQDILSKLEVAQRYEITYMRSVMEASSYHLLPLHALISSQLGGHTWGHSPPQTCHAFDPWQLQR